ncbi:MAG: L-cystine transport system permease protein [Mycobacterium sp.]|jgi:polar amino acid transport system permease protein|nr:L-cystine transport system permease protein [Mycobacterium sp.]
MPTLQELGDWLPRLLHGLVFTVQITVGAFVLAVVLGLVVALLRLSPRRRLVYIPATIYVEVLRGTPLILQLFFAYFALPSAGLRLSPVVAAVIGLGLNTSAYLSEVFRGAILGVDKGQWEASEALAMTWVGMMRHTILPQAFRSAIPPTGNYAISLFKDSALASTVSVSELLFTGQVIGSETFKYMQVYLVIGLLYLALSYPTSRAVLRLERRLDLSTRTSAPRRPRRDLLAAKPGV